MAGCECRSVVVGVTAQSHKGVEFVSAVDVETVKAQVEAALRDGRPGAILIGWLPPEPALLRYLCEVFGHINSDASGEAIPVVWDPVVSATLGDLPAASSGLADLLRYVSVVTPSLNEARWLVADYSLSAAEAAAALQETGVKTVIITGGDNEQQQRFAWVTDLIFSFADSDYPETVARPSFALHQQREAIQAHGTGSQFSAALAVQIAMGTRLYDVIVLAAAAARQALIASTGAQDSGVADAAYRNCLATPLPGNGGDWPLISDIGKYPRAEGFEPYSPGLYALSESLEHLEMILRIGVDTVQWRIKSPGPEYRSQTRQAMAMCRRRGVSFWLNDDWSLALELKPDGVHLGQEDLINADIDALCAAGVGLGISTHTEWEIARARAQKPSYIAFGPVFTPLSKRLRYQPLGVDCLGAWSKKYRAWPQTCIGGIVPENAGTVASTGIGSLAVVTCIAGEREDEPLIRRNIAELRAALEMFPPAPK
jgi:hydroxymethylpyrimidine kinase/phosphomethylpyrimidine kinase/thiamine-phosphate diphosphorylase